MLVMNHSCRSHWCGSSGTNIGWAHTFLFFLSFSFQVGRLSNALKRRGIVRGDVVAIYMPVTPDAVAAMMACARIGAVHSVIFAGFSAEAIATRIQVICKNHLCYVLCLVRFN